MTACRRCETALEDGDLRCAVCALPVLEAAPHPGDFPPRAQVLRCATCGAVIAFAPDAGAPRCGFCGATMAIDQPIDPVEAAQLRLPFTVDRARAEAALRGWLGARGWFAPRTLASEARLASLTPLAWAAWRVRAKARVAWSADSDAGARRSAWAPHAGETELVFHDILVPASRGLRAIEAQLLLPYYDLATAVPVDRPTGEVSGEHGAGAGRSSARTAGADEAAAPPEVEGEGQIEGFDAQCSAARRLVHDRIEALARVAVEPRITGRRYRNVHVACLLERQTTERVALPAWIFAYHYRGQPYRAIVHGQRAEVVFGRAPLDWRKVGWLVAVGVVAAALAVWYVLAR